MNFTNMRDYLKSSIRQFDADPPDDDYQRGYLACLVESLKALEEIEDK